MEIIDRDTQSDPARASQLAKALINSDKVDLMLSTSTPEVVNPVSDACEAAGVPCLSTVMPWEAWYFGRGAKPGAALAVQVDLSFPLRRCRIRQDLHFEWSNGQVQTNKKVGVMYPNDADGNAIREHMIPLFEKAGFTVFDPGGYEDGTTDYSAQIAKFKAEECEIFNSFPDSARLRHVLASGRATGLRQEMKIQSIAKTGLFPSQMEALGALAYNIASACLLASDLPLQVAADRHHIEGAGRRLRKERPAGNGTSNSAPPCRCSMPAPSCSRRQPIRRTRRRWPRR